MMTFNRVLAQDPEKLQFCAEVRWAERDNGAVWALSTRFHKYFRRAVSKHEVRLFYNALVWSICILDL